MEPRSVAAAPLAPNTDALGFFRWGRIGDQILVTTDPGDWAVLTEPQFGDLLAAHFKRVAGERDSAASRANARLSCRGRPGGRGPRRTRRAALVSFSRWFGAVRLPLSG